ncbi:MAG: sialate O-acetylesterase [Treponema sp.]|jgi:sialate O-acetylesterase|nr:sialate O-acetylesterase [Treponema sp.]
MAGLAVRTAPLFSDHMVLQREKPVRVWGWGGDEGGTVRVCWECGEHRVSAVTAVYGGAWNLMLPPLAAGLSGELVVSDKKNEIRFRNVITGDVWFAGGQSNMEMELVNCKNGPAELAACANPHIRFYQVVKRAVVDDDYLREEAQAAWQVCAPDTAAMLSAAAYFFARKINADLNVPIGIINCSWGGTSISTWMSREQLQRSRAGQRFIDDYSVKVGNKTDARYNAEMEEYFTQWREWDARICARREKEPDVSWETLNKECGQCPWPQPAGNASPYCPTNLHTARIRRVAPFTIKGFLYYQGEEDDLRAADYREMMYHLVRQWRADWADDRLPFLFVQLPMFASREEMESGNPPRHWCLMRESQYLASLDIAHSGLAVIIDCGEYDNIHPLDKQTVGFRLALQALRKVYGHTEIEADGPVFSWAETTEDGGSLRLHFNHAENGLEFRGAANGFEIAAAQGPYGPAQARIDGNDVVISSSAMARPCRARYAWTKFGPTPLYAKNGLPAMPFRTHADE